jgi:FKBP-type peptidyl-prolyl cis-trans isomerase
MKKSIILLSLVILVAFGAAAQKKSKKNEPVETAPAPTTAQLLTAADSLSYSFGMLIGTNLLTQKVEGINSSVLVIGLDHGYSGKNMQFTQEEANQIVQDYFNSMVKNESDQNLKESEVFLVKNKLEEGVVTLPSGLQYKVLEKGEGPSPLATEQVKVHYTGSLIDGTIFDSSIERGEPIVFGVNQVIPGWTEALQLMSVGSRWMLYIPPYLAYGESGAGGVIGPNQALIFEVQLIEIIKE